jgi:hypothetical protein
MNFNSFTALSKKATPYTISHLKAAENGEEAPIEEIENTFASAIGTRLKGNVHILGAPRKALTGLFWLVVASAAVPLLYHLTRIFVLRLPLYDLVIVVL